MSFIVQGDGIERAQRMLAGIPRGADKAIANALNKSARTAVTGVIRGIKENYMIQSPKARKYGTFIRRAKPGNLTARINIKGSVLVLSYFKITPKAPARITPFAQVKKGGGGSLPRAFVAMMSNGHIGVFERMQDGTGGSIKKYMKEHTPRVKRRGTGRTKGRASIRQLFGPSASYMAKNPKIHAAMTLDVQRTFAENLEAQITRLLAK